MVHREQTIRARHELFAGACAIIERDAHLTSLGLASVAEELGMSTRHLQRVFAGIGRTTFRSYMDSVRMERAAVLLREELPARPVPVRSVREVAAMVGYSQPANFAKAFRRYWGKPPHSLRR